MRNFFFILRELGIRHSFDYPQRLFLAQERNRTLWGCKKLLEHFGVQVTAVKVEPKSLEDISYPFVCQSPEGLIAIRKEPANLEAFHRIWDGYALLCDTSRAREPYYLWHKLEDTLIYRMNWLAAAGAILTLLCFLWEGFSFPTLLLTIFNLLGLLFSYRSAVNECAGSCSVVTESPAGKIFGYSLSVIGIAYFGVSLLPALFVPSWYPLWGWIAVLAMVMPLWSIPYQAFVAQAWCKNCLVVQLMVVLSAVVVGWNGLPLEGIFQLQPLIVLPSLYLLAVYGLDIVFNHYKTVQHPPMDATVPKLMRNPVLREEILHSGRKFDTSGVPAVWLLNPEGKQELFLAISLRCVFCKEQFFKIYKERQKGGLKDYRIKIVISHSPQDSKVLDVLAATALHQSGEAAMKLLSEWYEEQNRKLFLLNAKKDLPMEGVRENLDRINQVVEQMGVSELPLLVLNGHEVTSTIFWAKVELE